MKATGIVYLVGAGPGDPGLLTRRGAELLGRAEVVIYDRLVNPALLRLAPASAERIARGHFQEAAVPQEAMTALLIAKARDGKTVVRLKGGDPFVFGRGGEEAAELAAAKIPFEVVPGVSAAIAGPTYGGIPLTHRAYCSSFTVFTGHDDPSDEATALRYEQIAKIPGTKVVLMGVKRLAELTESLIAHGLPPETPVAMIHWATLARQHSVEGTLATIVQRATAADLQPPTVLVIGDVVKLRSQLNWFEQRPLFGQRVVVTRSREQAGDLTRLLAERGADVLEVPTIKILPPQDRELLTDALLELNAYDWLIFTSTNGVTEFFHYFFKAFEDLRDIGGVRIAAVGPATAAKLKALHLKVDLMPADHTAIGVAKALASYESIENLRFCLLRAEDANPDLPEELEAGGGIVDDIPVYRTVPDTEDLDGASASLLAAGADWVTFTSGSTVQSFTARFNLPELLKQFPNLKLASIGPETTKAIQALGLAPAVEAKPHTMEGLVAALEKLRAPKPAARQPARQPKR
jgi:uroporphyrinogen III methyltransferase/synthase